MNKRHIIKTIITVSLMMMSGWAWAQTNVKRPDVLAWPENPAGPINYNFSIIDTTGYPKGIVGWKIKGQVSQTYKVIPPEKNLSLNASGDAVNYGAGIYNYKGKIGMLNSQSNDNSIAFAVNTTGKSNIRVTYDMMTIRSPALRSNRAVLQYRIGNSDATNFTTIPESEYFSSEVRQVHGTDALKCQTFSILLPDACNNQELVQLRFVARDETAGDLHRSSFAINNLSVGVSQNNDLYVTMAPSSISGLTHDLHTTLSSVKSFKLKARNITALASIQVQGGFEISLSENAGYCDTINLSQSSGSPSTIDNIDIYVRLKEGLERGSYPGSISFSHDGAAYPTVIYLSGEVVEPLGSGDLFDFEGQGETKTDFPSGNVSLSGFLWNMTNAKIGTHLVDDFKDGARSAHLHGDLTASITMIADKPHGLGVIRFIYSRHQAQIQYEWMVEYSRDQGENWIQIGEFKPNDDDTVQIFHKRVDIPGNVRIRIRRSGETNGTDTKGHLNIDNIFLSDYDGYDIYPDEEEPIGENTSAVITGDGFLGANIIYVAPDDYTAFPNDEFIPDTRGKWELFGSGSATITLNTTNDWFAWLENGIWHALEGPFEDTQIVINIDTVDGAGGTMFEYMTGNGENPTLPVELSNFTVALNAKGKPHISWTTQSETAMNGFYIYRGMNRNLDEAILISGLIPATNSSLAQNYSFEDNEIYENGVYYYWLNMSDLNGRESYLGPMQLSYNFEQSGAPEMVYQTGFKSVYPNPFNPSTNIAFELSGKSEVNLSVYNIRGQLVRSFAPFTHEKGQGSIVWDGKDDAGRQVSSGIYFFRMKVGAKSYNTKALMLK